jgi:hypothetical protein
MQKRKRINIGFLLTILTVLTVIILVVRADRARAGYTQAISEKLQTVILSETHAAIYPPEALENSPISEAHFLAAKAEAKRSTDELYTDDKVSARRLGHITEILERQQKGDIVLTSVQIGAPFTFKVTGEADYLKAEVEEGTLLVEAEVEKKGRSAQEVEIALTALFRLDAGEPLLLDLDGELAKEIFAAFDPSFKTSSAPYPFNDFGGFPHDF